MSTPSACVLALSLACLAGCRDAGGDSGADGGRPIPVSQVGVNGCAGPDQAFASGQTPAAVALAVLVPGPSSAIAAARGEETLYATGASGQVVAIDVSGPAPVETELAAAGDVADLLAGFGIVTPPDLTGIAVLDAARLVVADRTSNTLLTVPRTPPMGGPADVELFAGLPSTSPGFADGLALGPAGLARFAFTAPTQLCPSGDGRVFVADPGNHAIRAVKSGAVVTLAGAGTPGFADGSLGGTLFDTPTGLTITCSNALLVSELGGTFGGNRLRLVAVGASSPFGGFFGATTTFVGDGVAETLGGSQDVARVAAPVSPVATSAGDVYWIDAGTGVLRRFRSGGECDCPLFDDCDAAALAPTFPAGNTFSLATTEGGLLFVLDATAGTLWRVTP